MPCGLRKARSERVSPRGRKPVAALQKTRDQDPLCAREIGRRGIGRLSGHARHACAIQTGFEVETLVSNTDVEVVERQNEANKRYEKSARYGIDCDVNGGPSRKTQDRENAHNG